MNILTSIILIGLAIYLFTWRIRYNVKRKKPNYTDEDRNFFDTMSLKFGEGAGFWAAACDETFQPEIDALAIVIGLSFLIGGIMILFIN